MSVALSGRRTACLVSLFSTAFGSIASASEDMTEFMREASAFVAEATRENVPPVDIRRGHPLELQAAVFGERPVPLLRPVDVAAAFDPMQGEIVIADNVDLGTPQGLSFLVHELIHSQQYAAGRQTLVICWGSLEGEAYAIQAQFLRSRGLHQEALLYEILGMMQASCNDHLR